MAGVVTGLSSPNFVTTFTDYDGDGELHFTPSVGPAVCGMHIQFVDLLTCEITNTAQF